MNLLLETKEDCEQGRLPSIYYINKKTNTTSQYWQYLTPYFNYISPLSNVNTIIGGDSMTHKQGCNSKKEQNKKQRSAQEKAQDIKNATFIAGMNQPNHPNT